MASLHWLCGKTIFPFYESSEAGVRNWNTKLSHFPVLHFVLGSKSHTKVGPNLLWQQSQDSSIRPLTHLWNVGSTQETQYFLS